MSKPLHLKPKNSKNAGKGQYVGKSRKTKLKMRVVQVSLARSGEEKIIQFCKKHEEQLSYKSVINYVKVSW